MYWDGGTVANTPLAPAIDAGAEEVVVVLMTPWDEDQATTSLPQRLLDAAGMAFEWALLASFQADLKMFRRVNELVRLQIENARLRAANAMMLRQLQGEAVNELLVDENQDGIPDILQKDFKLLPEPIIVAPERPIPVDQIVRYNLKGHEAVYRMGYEAARRAWREAGRTVEGEAPPPAPDRP